MASAAMGRYIGIPLLILAAILDATLMAELRIGGGAPDLVFLLVVSWALLSTVQEAMMWAVIGGVLKDTLPRRWGIRAGHGDVAFAADSFGEVRRNNLRFRNAAAGTVSTTWEFGALRSYGVAIGEGLRYVTLPTMISMIRSCPYFAPQGSFTSGLRPGGSGWSSRAQRQLRSGLT
jgi:cell shape-determining protein MreD